MNQINIGPGDLEVFLAVAEQKSFRRAAHQLGLAQPTVTYRIQRLEHTLGVVLFSRTTRRVELSAAGERLLSYAERTVVELRSVVHEFRAEAALKHGHIALAAASTVAATVLPPLIQRFLLRHPGVEISLRDDYVLPILDSLLQEKIDLAVVPLDNDNMGRTDFDFQPLFNDEFVIVAPKDHPAAMVGSLKLSAAVRYPFVSLPQSSSVWLTTERAFEACGAKFQPTLQAYNLFTLIGLVEAGMGLTLLPRIIMQRLNLNTVSVIHIQDVTISRCIGIVTVHGRALSSAAASLYKSLQISLEQQLPVSPRVDK